MGCERPPTSKATRFPKEATPTYPRSTPTPATNRLKLRRSWLPARCERQHRGHRCDRCDWRHRRDRGHRRHRRGRRHRHGRRYRCGRQNRRDWRHRRDGRHRRHRRDGRHRRDRRRRASHPLPGRMGLERPPTSKATRFPKEATPTYPRSTPTPATNRLKLRHLGCCSLRKAAPGPPVRPGRLAPQARSGPQARLAPPA